MVLKNYLSENYSENVDTILTLIHQLEKNGIQENSIEFMFLPDFIELFIWFRKLFYINKSF
jgi:hypothetical protein